MTEDTARRAQGLLRDWDGGMATDAPQPLIFNAWVHHFYGRVLQQAGIPVSDGGPLAEFVSYVLTPAGAHWCGGDCTATLQASLTEAINDLARRFGDDPTRWRWGDAHPAVFAHPMLRPLPILGRLATLSIPSPGDDTTIDRGGPHTNSSHRCMGRSIEGSMISPISTVRCSSWPPASRATCSAVTRAIFSPAGVTVPRSRLARHKTQPRQPSG